MTHITPKHYVYIFTYFMCTGNMPRCSATGCKNRYGPKHEPGKSFHWWVFYIYDLEHFL